MDPSLAKTHPLELPSILELIGAVLDNNDDVGSLKACSLVNHEWHRLFAPFLWWRVIDNLDKLLKRLHKARFGEDVIVDPAAQLEPEFLALVDEFTKKVDDPSLPSAIHRHRRTHLSTPSFLSFVILGWLCDQIRVVDYYFSIPPRFENYNASLGAMVAPENCRMSDEYCNSHQRIDSVVGILENNPQLEVISLNDNSGYSYNPPFQWQQLDDRTTSETPRWPKLDAFTIKMANVDRHFLEILLHNSPNLQKLQLQNIKIITVRGNNGNRSIFPDPTAAPSYKDQIQNYLRPLSLGGRNAANQDQDPHSSDKLNYPFARLEDLTILQLDGISVERQMAFALGLPALKSFSFRADPDLGSFSLFFRPGFHQLTTLVLVGDFNQEVLVRAANRLQHLTLSGSTVVDEALFRTICRHNETLETVVIKADINNAVDQTSYPNRGEGLHQILRTCHRLEKFLVLSPLFNCNPALFRDQPWACTRLRTLIVVPDCVPKYPTYTAFHSQAAFFGQVSTLTELKELGFGGGTGENEFMPDEGLHLLTGLKELEVLNLRSGSLETNAQVTEEHAKLVASEWPNLKAIKGLYHYACRPFVDQVKLSRPDIDFSYH
ncbi:hypothetical protein BGX23_010249 [Mortierella sp. AD031]|nr:hypothetical protein BGX23_010249 [Mortierella sp. AD031]KAG0201672.1 hypothetical protein BGX33_010167 [Mortierella sp. NVP41]